MATSPNYAWAEPDNSSLVKNGAQDIRALGDAIDTSVWNVGYGQAGKNKILNGDFNINQRAFTSNTTSGVYNFDRFNQLSSGGTTTVTPQTFTPGAAPVAGYEASNFVRIVTASQSGVGDYALIQQKVEDVRTFAGRTVTVSLWAKASTGTPKIGLSLEQQFGSGGSASVITSAATTTITTSWARYSFTVSLPSITGKTIGTNNAVCVMFFTSAGTTISAAGYAAVGIQNITADFWGVQLEYGSYATPFQTATGTLQGELAACQRYYYRRTAVDTYEALSQPFNASSTTRAYFQVVFPVTMRTQPTVFDYSTTYSLYRISDVVTFTTPTAFTLDTSGTSKDIGFFLADCASGLTQYRSYALTGSTTTTDGYIGFGAEL
jgi:hypothetical protein